jgi:hypothetical protein
VQLVKNRQRRKRTLILVEMPDHMRRAREARACFFRHDDGYQAVCAPRSLNEQSRSRWFLTAFCHCRRGHCYHTLGGIEATAVWPMEYIKVHTTFILVM